MDDQTALDELAASGTGYSAAVSCAHCLEAAGVDPALAGPLAVLLGVVVRLGIDWLERRARRRAAAADAAPPTRD